ncbi:MAG: HU family DNA-binding protein [Dehalococcoidia bacterium]
MTKAELIERVAKIAGTTTRDAENVLDGFRDLVQATVKRGDEISYHGLGKFSRSARRPRVVLNPRTGEPMNLPAMKVPRFSASAGFKRVVRGDDTAPRLPRAA